MKRKFFSSKVIDMKRTAQEQIEDGIKKIQLLVERNYSDLDVMLTIKREFPERANEILEKAVAQGLIRMARIGGYVVEKQKEE